MTSLSAEYRNRLHATQQSRRIRKAEERRNSGPVDVDDFYVPTSPSSQPRRRSKTPQPNTYSRSLNQQENHGEERRSQSAPRSISEQQSTPPSNNRQWANNGETVFCFQPGRRRFKAPRRPIAAVHHSETTDKKSLNQFQLYNEIQKQDDVYAQRVLKHQSNNVVHHQSSVQGKTKNAEISNNPRIDLRILDKPDTVDMASEKKIAATDDPRIYAASYYAKKVGVNSKSSSQSQGKSRDSPVDTKSKHTAKTITRSMSQKMADCLLLSKNFFDDEPADSTRRRSTNHLTSLCFVDNLADVSHDTIDITTIDVNSYDGRSPNVSALHENSPFHNGTTSNQNGKHIHNISRTSTKKWQEDSSTNQTTTVSTSSSDNEQEYDDTITHDTITSDSVPRPPKVLNVIKGIPKETKQPPFPSHPIIQVNPDDYDYSYRKKRVIPQPVHEDIDFLSELAVTSTIPEAPGGLIGPRQQRDLQRRPRGMFELVTSNDDGDNADEMTTACSTPFDESDEKLHQDSRGNGSVPDMTNDAKQWTVKYNEAILELKRQRMLVATVENQLKASVLELHAVKSDLQKTKDDAAERARTYADATAKIVQERLDSDEKLKEEQQANQTLKDEVECLKREVINLSLELERAVHRNTWSSFQNLPESSPGIGNNALADDLSTTSNKSDSHPVKAAEAHPIESCTTSNAQMDEATKALEFMSEKLQASQKEVADLQSQLTAMRVASELYNMTYEQLQRERDDAIAQKGIIQREMKQAKAKIKEMDIQTDLFEREMKETARLKEEIVSLTNELSYSNIRASDYATNVRRLEEELIRAQLHAAKYEIQASALEKELRESTRTIPVAARHGQHEGSSLPIEKEIAHKSQLELMHSSIELSTERQLVEEELVQRFTTTSLQSDNVSMAIDNKATSRGSVGKGNRGRGSDLLEILRKKLEPT
jgi:hypothetical protein